MKHVLFRTAFSHFNAFSLDLRDRSNRTTLPHFLNKHTHTHNSKMFGLEHFYHSKTGTLTYILYCKETKAAAIIDPVLDVDVRHGLVT